MHKVIDETFVAIWKSIPDDQIQVVWAAVAQFEYWTHRIANLFEPNPLWKK